MKSGNLNFLEPSGPLQACNGIALPLPLHGQNYCGTLVQFQHDTSTTDRMFCICKILEKKQDYNGAIY
jgi:hypothetical protein